MSLQLNGTDGVTFNDGSEQWAAASPIGPKNLIINGNMQIAQRGTSSTGITTSGYYTVDRFGTLQTGLGTWTQTQDTDVPTGEGFSSSFKLDCTTADATLDAGDRLFLRQGIEAQNLQHLKFNTSSAESITLSFWVKSNKTGTYSLAFINEDSSRSYVTTYSISVADTWEKKTITISGDTSGAINNDNGVGLWIYWNFGAGSTWGGGSVNNAWESTVNANLGAGTTVNLADSTSNYLNITGVQLEVGDTATPFEVMPYDMQLARCMRYCINYLAGGTVADSATFGAGVVYQSTRFLGYVQLPTRMRDVPSISPISPTALYVAAGGVVKLVTNLEIVGSPITLRIDADTSTAMTVGHGAFLQYNNASEDIILDAEL